MAADIETATAAPSRVRFVVLVFLCAAATIAYVQRSSLGVVEEVMREELKLTKEESAWVVSSGFFFTYALFQVPTGWLGHVWGSRRALALFSFIGSAATSLFAVATGFPGLVACRGAMGFSQAGLFPCAMGTIKSWFPVSQRAFAAGPLTACMQVGAAAGAAATGWMSDRIGWRSTFMVFSLPSLIWAVWFYLWFRDHPRDHTAVNDGELDLLGSGAAGPPARQGADDAGPIPWGQLLLSVPLAWFCAQQFCRAAGYVFYSSWFTTYLKEARGVESLAAAGVLTSLPLCGFGVGSLVGGWLSDWLLIRTGSRRFSRQGLAIASQLACALFVLAAYPVRDATLAVLIISAGSFCAAVGGPVAYAVSADIGGHHVRPVFSLMNMWGNIGAFAFPLVVPLLFGKGKQTNWDGVMILFGAIHVAAAICWLGFNPDRPILPERAPESPDGTKNIELPVSNIESSE
ncbi:MAG: MFS transporter [Deltaproteobacteria bacterium]